MFKSYSSIMCISKGKTWKSIQMLNQTDKLKFAIDQIFSGLQLQHLLCCVYTCGFDN